MPAAGRADDVSEEIRQLTAQIRDLVGQLADIPGQNVQTVIHKSEGFGAWGTAAVVACFCTWFGLILVMFDIHDLRAWVDVLKQRVTILESRGK